MFVTPSVFKDRMINIQTLLEGDLGKAEFQIFGGISWVYNLKNVSVCWVGKHVERYGGPL